MFQKASQDVIKLQKGVNKFAVAQNDNGKKSGMWVKVAKLLQNVATIFAAKHTDDLGKQTKDSHDEGKIWGMIKAGKMDEVKAHLKKNRDDLTCRGAVGDIPLHVCFLYNGSGPKATQICMDMARFMMEMNPDILIEPYKGQLYTGENILHIAIVNRNHELAVELAKLNQDLLSGQAKGTFFQFGSRCYFGEYPLAFAAATNQLKLFDALFALAPGLLNEQDSNGNTILHVLVIRNLKKAYTHVKETWKKHFLSDSDPKPEPALWNIKNSEGLTPFLLAAKLGSKEMFEFLLEEGKEVQWSYGPVTCQLYPLDQLEHEADDTNCSTVRDTDSSALELIVEKSHFDLLTHPRIKDLLDKKWTQIQPILSKRLVFVCFYLTVLSRFLIQRRLYIQQIQNMGKCIPDSFIWYEYMALYVLVVSGACWKGMREFKEMWSHGINKYFSCTGSAFLENFLSISFFLSIIGFLCFSFFESSLELDALCLGLASLFAFSYLFIFLLAFEITGPMVIMVYKMLFNDVLRFFMVYCVFILGFSHAFFVLDHSKSSGTIMKSIGCLFDATFGDFDINGHLEMEAPFRSISAMLLVCYVVLVSIQLLNFLIAMMGNTYTQINDDSKKHWELERARIIFAFELEMTPTERQQSLKYHVEIKDKRYFQVEVVDDTWELDNETLEIEARHCQEEVVDNSSELNS